MTASDVSKAGGIQPGPMFAGATWGLDIYQELRGDNRSFRVFLCWGIVARIYAEIPFFIRRILLTPVKTPSFSSWPGADASGEDLNKSIKKIISKVTTE